jgi:hypothetical protein
MLLLGCLITHMAPRRRGGKLIFVSKSKFSVAWGYPKRDSKIAIFEIEFYGWWFLSQFFFIGDGIFHNFFWWGRKSNDVNVILLLFTLLCCFSVDWSLAWLHDKGEVNRFPFPVTGEIMQLRWFLGYNFCIGDGDLSQFFLVGSGGEKYVPPNPPTHLILEQP